MADWLVQPLRRAAHSTMLAAGASPDLDIPRLKRCSGAQVFYRRLQPLSRRLLVARMCTAVQRLHIVWVMLQRLAAKMMCVTNGA